MDERDERGRAFPTRALHARTPPTHMTCLGRSSGRQGTSSFLATGDVLVPSPGFMVDVDYSRPF